jgi:quinol monooxygenase YgiN
VALAIIIEFDVKPECRDEFLRKLRQDAVATLQDDGCYRMEILTACDDANRILLSELWRDFAAIEAHRDKPGHSHGWQEPLINAKRTTRCVIDQAR